MSAAHCVMSGAVRVTLTVWRCCSMAGNGAKALQDQLEQVRAAPLCIAQARPAPTPPRGRRSSRPASGGKLPARSDDAWPRCVRHAHRRAWAGPACRLDRAAGRRTRSARRCGARRLSRRSVRRRWRSRQPRSATRSDAAPRIWRARSRSVTRPCSFALGLRCAQAAPGRAGGAAL